MNRRKNFEKKYKKQDIINEELFYSGKVTLNKIMSKDVGMKRALKYMGLTYPVCTPWEDVAYKFSFLSYEELVSLVETRKIHPSVLRYVYEYQAHGMYDTLIVEYLFNIGWLDINNALYFHNTYGDIRIVEEYLRFGGNDIDWNVVSGKCRNFCEVTDDEREFVRKYQDKLAPYLDLDEFGIGVA